MLVDYHIENAEIHQDLAFGNESDFEHDTYLAMSCYATCEAKEELVR